MSSYFLPHNIKINIMTGNNFTRSENKNTEALFTTHMIYTDVSKLCQNIADFFFNVPAVYSF